MFIKLEFISETEKAYQLPNGSWIPKSILDDRGLKHPYYQIKNWWINKSYEKLHENEDLTTIKVFEGLNPLIINMEDIPQDIREYWSKYWKSLSSNISYDYEPRLWGNECFPGEMSSYFD